MISSSGLDHDLAAAGLGGDVARLIGAHLLQVAGAVDGAAQSAGDGRDMRVHAALDMGPAYADTACFQKHADGVLQAVDVAPGVGLGAAHGQAQVIGLGRGGVVPLVRQSLGLQRLQHGLAVPLQRGLGHEFGQIGRGGVLQQHVVALQGVEFLQVAPGHRVFVRVDHGDGAVVAHQLGQGLRLGSLQQQMVTVHVDAVGGDALAGVGAVGVGARHDDDVDAIEHGLQ